MNMLPDFPEIKKELSRIVFDYLDFKFKDDQFLSEIKHYPVHEGTGTEVKTFDGYKDYSKYKDFESIINVTPNEIIEKGIEGFINSIDIISKDFIQNKIGYIFEKINEVTEKTGNVVDCKGKQLTKELLLESLRIQQIDFLPTGEPIMPKLYLSPETYKQIAPQLKEWEKDVNYINKQNKVIENKRKEWIDRENNRKLVD